MKTLIYNDLKDFPYCRMVISKFCPEHDHIFFEFAICTKGSYTNVINGKKKEITKGNIILLRPQDRHFFKSSVGHTHYDVYVPESKLKSICESISPELFDNLTSAPLQLNFTVSDHDLQLIESEITAINNTTEKNVMLEASHTCVVSKIITAWLKNYYARKENYPLWISTLIQQMMAENSLSIPLNQLIDNTNFSHSYVCRQFKKYTGKTVQEYFSDIKFAYALSLLQDKNVNVSEIAECLNYSSVSNFTMAFKKKYGTTPTEYKKLIK